MQDDSEVPQPASAPDSGADEAPVQSPRPSTFFLEWIAIPEETDDADIDGLVELEIENAAPFPIEQLAWAWIAHPTRSHVLCYAAPRDLLRKTGLHHFDGHEPIIPSFALTALIEGDAPFNVVQCGEEGVALSYRADGTPQQADSIDQLSDDLAAHVQEALELDSLPDRSDIRYSRLELESCSEDAGCRAILRDADAPEETQSLTLGSEALWFGDLRDRDLKAQRRKDLRFSGLVWKALSQVIILLLVLLGLEVAQWSTAQFLAFRERHLDAQAPVVSRLEQQQSFLFKLEEIEQSQMQPFAVLAILNENRPASIQFIRAEAIDSSNFEISARGKTVNEVNRYIQQFQNNPAFQSITHNVRRTGAGAVDFDIAIVIDQLPDVKPLTPTVDEQEDKA